MRVRLRFQKHGKIRFVGHRDVARLFERALRKIGFPVTYSEGFSPRVKLSFGLALPTCYESDAEYLDIPIEESSVTDGRIVMVGRGEGSSYTAEELVRLLSDALPSGLDVVNLVVEPRGGPSLQESVIACTWQFDVVGLDESAAQRAVDRIVGETTLVAQRKKKGTMVEEDIRPAVHALHVEGESDRGAVIVADLSASPRVVRPAELLDALASDAALGVARRRNQWIGEEGARHEPLPPLAPPPTPAFAAGTQEGTPE